MRNRRTTLVTSAVVSVAAAAAVTAVAIGAGSSAGSTPSAGKDHAGQSRTAVLHTTTATVQGTRERILVDAKGDPLYTYRPDTTTTSHVSGQLAVLWPPLVAGSARARGAAGTFTTVSTRNGSQVAYNGHFLYTFVQDKPGQVTGQGVQDFFVATPGISQLESAGGASAPTGGGY